MQKNMLSSAHGTRIDHILGHKSSLSKFKKTEIVPSIFSDHNVVRLDIDYRKKKLQKTNSWRLNNTLLNNKEVTEEIRRESRFLETNYNENTRTQNLRDSAKIALRGKFIATQSYLKKQEKHQIDNLTLHLKHLEKEEQKTPNVSIRK